MSCASRGAAVALFNGRDGEWQATVAETGKRGGVLIAQTQSAPFVYRQTCG